jgi:hypothetical protein
MIVVTVQYTEEGTANYNGGTSLQFYNLNEAILFAENESSIYPGTPTQSLSLCKVFNDGVIVSVWWNGNDITA